MKNQALDLRAIQNPGLRIATVYASDGDELELVGGEPAELVPSCLLRPEPGDLVLCVDAGRARVLAVLQRAARSSPARLGVAGTPRLEFAAQEIELRAERSLTLTSRHDCEVTAAAGSLRLNAENLAMTVADSIIGVATEVLTTAQVITQRADALLSTLARRQLWVAEKEMRIDAETIQMG
jgi:hypothetical protein